METSKSCDVCGQGAGSDQCTECHQVLCSTCTAVHSKLNTTKFHQVVAVETAKTPAVMIQINGEMLPDEEATVNGLNSKRPRRNVSGSSQSLLLCSVHNQDFDFYCTVDEQPVCRTCKLIEHRRCTDFLPLAEAAGADDSVIADTLESIRVVETELYKVLRGKTFAKESLETGRQQVLDQLAQLRHKFDTLETNTVNQLTQLYQTSAGDQDKHIEVIHETQELVAQLREQAQAVAETGTSEEKLVAATTAEKDLRKYSEVLNDISVITLTSIFFNQHAFWKSVEDLGEVCTEKVSHQIGLAKFVPCDIPLRLESDQEDTFITAVEVFPDGRKLLLDLTNKKLKLYSSDNKLLSELSFSEEVHDMTLLNNSTALVTVPSMKEKSLHKVSITDNKLSLAGHVLVLDTTPGLVTRVDDTTLLSVSMKDKKVFFILADENGSVKKAMISSPNIRRLIKQPIKAVMNSATNTIYILDFYSGCITVDLSHMQVQERTDLLYEFYGGMALDSDGCVYLECGRKEAGTMYSNILQLSPQGDVLQALFPRDISPRIIPLKIASRKMYVFTKNPEKNMTFGCLLHRLVRAQGHMA